MRQPRDPYRELGVPRGATEEQIKAAHRRLAKRYHPDASAGERERFLAIQEAYQILADPLQRREWDARHAPGPVRATQATHGAPMARSRRGTPPRPDVTSQTARTSRGTTHGRSHTGRTHHEPGPDAQAPMREPGTQSYTWSAAGVPWWEDFRPRPDGSGAARATAQAAQAPGPGTPGTPAGPGAPDRGPDPYTRSSGTAWSSAARRYFRQGDADLPRGGQFRYRGTQVVTGAEARHVANEELRRTQAGTPPGPPRPPRPEPARQPRLLERLRRFLAGS
jgi:curved DNA-binding protein CbpA